MSDPFTRPEVCQHVTINIGFGSPPQGPPLPDEIKVIYDWGWNDEVEISDPRESLRFVRLASARLLEYINQKS
jgi:hypothetical protein